MNDMNRLLIVLLLGGLLYALYRYQYLVFGTPQLSSQEQLNNQKQIQGKSKVPSRQIISEKSKDKNNKVSIDNISQLSMGSLEDETGNNVYKPDSLLGSLASSAEEVETEMSNASSLFN